MIDKVNYEVGQYDTLPCGPAMTLCNNAFVDLCFRFEDILASSFEESPRGDKKRVNLVANNLMQLITNSYYSVTWVNIQQYKAAHPNDYIEDKDLGKVGQIS